MNNLCNKSVPIVDDDARMLRALEKVRPAGEGYKVTCAALVEDAIAILTQRKAPIDLVITDLWMPLATGLYGFAGRSQSAAGFGGHRVDRLWQSRRQGRMPSPGRGGLSGETIGYAAIARGHRRRFCVAKDRCGNNLNRRE